MWNVLDEKRPEWKELEALMRAYHDRDPTPFYKCGLLLLGDKERERERERERREKRGGERWEVG